MWIPLALARATYARTHSAQKPSSMVMATCRAATAAGGPCQMTCGRPGAGGGIGGNVAGEVVVDVGAGRTWIAAEAPLRSFPQPVRTLATPSPRRLTSVRR